MYAHFDQETGDTQSLDVHLFNVAQSAVKAAQAVGQQDVVFLCGLYHDLGKADRKFQDKIIHHRQTHVDHSTAGAKFLLDKMGEVLQKHITEPEKIEFCESFIETVCYVISAHHGVYDIPVKENTDSLQEERIGKLFKRIVYGLEKGYYFESDVINFASKLENQLKSEKQVTLEQLILNAFDNYLSLWEKLSPQDDSEKDFYTTLVVRLYLSILKNADILDTINAYTNVIESMSSKKNMKSFQLIM